MLLCFTIILFTSVPSMSIHTYDNYDLHTVITHSYFLQGWLSVFHVLLAFMLLDKVTVVHASMVCYCFTFTFPSFFHVRMAWFLIVNHAQRNCCNWCLCFNVVVLSTGAVKCTLCALGHFAAVPGDCQILTATNNSVFKLSQFERGRRWAYASPGSVSN